MNKAQEAVNAFGVKDDELRRTRRDLGAAFEHMVNKCKQLQQDHETAISRTELLVQQQLTEMQGMIPE